MPENDSARIGKDGEIEIPEAILRRFGLTEGSMIEIEERDEGLFLRLATTHPPIEIYTPERKAEFLLSTAIYEEDYLEAREDVKKLGLDPDTILHSRPDST